MPQAVFLKLHSALIWILWGAAVERGAESLLKCIFWFTGSGMGWNSASSQVPSVANAAGPRSTLWVAKGYGEVLGAGALGWPRGMGWRGRWEGGSGWGTHVNLWLIHVNVWQKPLQYCKVISLQLIKNNWGGKKGMVNVWEISFTQEEVLIQTSSWARP